MHCAMIDSSALLGTSDCTVDVDSLLIQEYSGSFISEVQRYYCVAPEIVPRTLVSEVKLPTGQIMPRGTTFMIGIWETHHNPYEWNQPHIIKPRRFLKKENLKINQFIPFSAGGRKCIGYKYALVQIRTVLTRIIEDYRIYTDMDHETELTRIMTLNPSNGVKIRIEKRN